MNNSKISVKVDSQNHGLRINGQFFRIRTFKDELEEFLNTHSNKKLREIAEVLDKQPLTPYSEAHRMRTAIRKKIKF